MKQFDQLLFNRYFEDWSKFSSNKIKSLISVKAKNILPKLDDIDFSKKQRVKLGIDPTGADLHIGHLCPLFVQNIFIKSGHHIDLVIGDFTAKIGDPSGRSTDRKIITDAEIAQNFASWESQVKKYIDTSKLNLRKNSEWLSTTSMSQLVAILQNLNAAQILQRDDFRTRLEAGGVTMAELIYGTMQGLDSVALKSTIELGGIDQLLNLQQGREIQRIHGQPAQVIITNPILEGLNGDGRKMSKSYNNYIALNETPENKFGLIMSLSDSLLLQYYKCFGYLYEEEIPELEQFIKTHPMEAKKQLATYFVGIESKDLNAGKTERAKFEAKFARKDMTQVNFDQIKIKKNTLLLDALLTTNKFKSKGELKRLLQSNSIRDLDANEIITTDIEIKASMKIRVGKINFFEIKI